MTVAKPVAAMDASETVGPDMNSSELSAPVERRGARLYFLASLNSQASTLLRYIVLARLLGPEQLGIATTLVLTGAFFDLVSDTGSDRFLVQDRHGGTPEVQSLVQFVYAARGVIVGVMLTAISIPIAAFYKTPELAGGLAIFGLSPIILGFQHLDIRRSQREHDFRGHAICMIAADTTSLVVTAVAAWVTHDYRAILYGLIVRSVIFVTASQLLAKRPYHIAWNREHVPRLSKFAAPLMLNGLLLFVVTQGDRVIVARQLGLKDLGLYSATALLIYYPSMLLATYMHAMYIPLIAGRRDAPRDRERVSNELGGQTLLLAVGMAAGFAMVTPVLAPVMFGARFAQSSIVVALIGILQTTRFLLSWPTTVALAMGRTLTVLFSNAAHIFAFAGALIGVRIRGDLTGILTGFILGELLAVGVALLLLNRTVGLPWWKGLDRLLDFILSAGVIVAAVLTLARANEAALTSCLILAGALVFWLYRRERVVIQSSIAIAIRVTGPALGRLRPNSTPV